MPKPEYVSEEQKAAVQQGRLQKAIINGDGEVIDKINGSQAAPNKKEKDDDEEK